MGRSRLPSASKSTGSTPVKAGVGLIRSPSNVVLTARWCPVICTVNRPVVLGSPKNAMK